jgi:hypothetical protein
MSGRPAETNIQEQAIQRKVHPQLQMATERSPLPPRPSANHYVSLTSVGTPFKFMTHHIPPEVELKARSLVK